LLSLLKVPRISGTAKKYVRLELRKYLEKSRLEADSVS